MMFDQFNSTVETKPAEIPSASAHALTSLSAQQQPPLSTQARLFDETEDTKPAGALPSEPKPEPGAPAKNFRKTKIIATLGPATENGEIIRGILEAGVSVFRINLACISREAALKAVYAIRSISTELQRPVSLLLDTRAGHGRGAAPALTEEDWTELRFGLECGVDWLAVSAGCDGQAVRELRTFLAEQKKNAIGVLARIEQPASYANFDQIVQEADGVILTGENPVNECPWDESIQVTQKCVSARKPAILASGLKAKLSVALSARPDALMLTEETSVGLNPLQDVKVFARLICDEESSGLGGSARLGPVAAEPDQSVAAALRLAGETRANAIVIITRSGQSAIACAAWRPQTAPVFVFTPDARLARRLRLHYALNPIVLPFNGVDKTAIRTAEKVMREHELFVRGAKIVFLTDSVDPEQPGMTILQHELI